MGDMVESLAKLEVSNIHCSPCPLNQSVQPPELFIFPLQNTESF